MSQYKVDFDTMPWQQPIPGVRHRFVSHGGKKLRLVEYTKEMEPHWCSRGHLGMILDGRFEIRYDNATEIYEPGDGVFIPNGEEHRHMAVTLTETVRAVFVEEA
jgi:ethanolamine utilization protein EutQ (cupin superfamily)